MQIKKGKRRGLTQLFFLFLTVFALVIARQACDLVVIPFVRIPPKRHAIDFTFSTTYSI
jgi:hypothetical protein